ncbi:VOC family protein [Natrialba aegyptia]|uniref:Glyoxalase/bleomycin resistance protein/dioxygenase n=1 Tax=Natrialba aegyptia DSM 13077 TaxID=1227491 RepID=M0B0Q2_9EURY|nr:VOC family protein [Natrialba aegyptia]ELZ04127.1 glyoxalase/bleomycin resistance protein/dioxygenase [Natrialba aegyptia DSM 13077]
MDVIHTALWVSDLDRTREFYCDGLGLAENWSFTTDDGVENVYIGGENAEFQFKYDPEGGPGIDPGTMAHVAVGVESTDDAFERLLERADPPVQAEPETMSHIDRRVAFVEDPNGYVVELVERLDR